MTDTLLLTLPDSPAALRDATWADLAPHYDALAAAVDPGAGDPGWGARWLATWSTLDALVSEAAAVSYWEYSRHTDDPVRERRYLRWATEIGPELDEATTRLARRALALGLEAPGLGETLENWRTDVQLFREANKPRLAQVEEMSAEYDKLVGAMRVEWEGAQVPVMAVTQHFHSPDRAVRERAFVRHLAAYADARQEITGLYSRMVRLRGEIAREAGYPDYLRYRYAELHRREYGPEQARAWCDAVEQAVVPAVERARAYRESRLGLRPLRPWDTAAPLFGAEPLVPYRGAEELVAGGERVLSAVDPFIGDVLRTMRREGLLDLDNREGKAPGGYCTTFEVQGRSAIFMNAVGIADDVMTLFHEMGHALHHHLAARQPLVWTRHTGMEAAELASMAMEMLVRPHLGRPTGFYDARDAARAEYEHFEDILSYFPHFASVELFQQWVYTAADGAEPDAQDAAWLALRARFDRGSDWTGLDRIRAARWYRQSHILQVPFYYIEYGIAQLGALQVWRAARRDRQGAVARYLEALALGGTVSLRDIYAAAGVRLIFDAAGMAELVAEVEQRLAELREVLEA
ncbi:MAG TPA: M3 family oligoendopeptidase [Gemmatimonadaceae bacterium]